MPKINTYNKKEEISEAPQVEELLKNLEFHKSIQQITGRINNAVNLREIIVDIKEDIRKLFNIYSLTIYLVDQDKREVVTLEDDGKIIREIRFPIDNKTFAGWVAQKKKTLHIADAYNNREIRKIHDALSFDDSRDEATGVTTGQILASPILHDGVILGVMEIMNKKGGDTIDDYNQIFLDEIEACLARAFFMQMDFEKASHQHTAKFNKLIQDGLITAAQMDKAFKEAFEAKEDLATLLIKLYKISKRAIGSALADYYACPFTPYSDDLPVNHDLLVDIDKASLTKGIWIPLKVVKGRIHVLIDDPWNQDRRSEIEDRLDTSFIQYEISLVPDILKLIDRAYAEIAQKEEEHEDSPKMSLDQSLPDHDSRANKDNDKIPAKTTTGLTRRNIRSETKESRIPEEEKLLVAEKILSTNLPTDEREESPELKTPPKEQPVKAVQRETPSQIVKADIPVNAETASVTKDIYPSSDIGSLKPESSFSRPLTDVIYDAFSRRASDIHFEPDVAARQVTVRIRIEREFMARPSLSLENYEKMIDELKALADLDLRNRGLLQNGVMRLKRPSGDEINIRIALIPTRAGMEDTVIHLSHKSKVLPLELLGLSENNYADLSNLLRQPRGVIFIVGPAGTGVPATLHACLNHINTPEKKIWTAEETIEFTQNGLRQVGVDSRKGFEFPRVLRAILNADPDVIMLSSIPDLETAGLCMEASLKGRLVLSGLGTESIVETIERCLDMGLNHLALADAMLSIVEQRLIKSLCPTCKERYHPGREEYEDLAEMYGKDAFDKLNIPYTGGSFFFRPKGCDACDQTGYKGWMCVSEIFVFSAGIKRMLRQKESPESIYQTALNAGMKTLLQDGLSKVIQGYSDFRQIRLTCLK